MFYTDIHCHMLSGVDDGAQNADEMFAMLDMAYQAGTRRICLTPHCQPSLFGDNALLACASFEKLRMHAAEHFPDVELGLASELGYYSDWRCALEEGRCRLIGDRYLLTDFLPSVSLFAMRYAVDDMLSAGISLILAHVDRYEALYGQYDLLRDWTRRGVLLQINASAVTAKHGLKHRSHIRKLFMKCPIAAVASDGHRTEKRLPVLNQAEEVLASRYGADAALFWLSTAPSLIFEGKKL